MLIKCVNKSFILHPPPLTSVHLTKAVSSIQRNDVQHFTAVIHLNHGYERPTQNIKRSFKNVCNRFFPQFFKL